MEDRSIDNSLRTIMDSISVGKSYFDIDGDDVQPLSERKDLYQEPPKTPELRRQWTWRGDPDITGADFSISIVTEGVQKVVTYYVHKKILVRSDGPRQCKYFSKYISRKMSSSSKRRGRSIDSVKVELDRKEAENFPIVLDFMYSEVQESSDDTCSYSSERRYSPRKIGSFRKTSPLKSASTFETVSTMTNGSQSCPSISRNVTLTPRDNMDDVESHRAALGDSVSTENAVSLRYLAIKLDNIGLRHAVNRFIQDDLCYQTGPLYMIAAGEYQDERLLESAKRLCIENFKQIDIKTITRLPLALFRSIIESFESTFAKEGEVDEERSKTISEVVCRYLEKHPRRRCAELLLDLTDPGIMPYIDSEAAIGLTAIIKDLDETDVALHWNGLVRFSQRCAKAVVHEYGWGDFSVQAALEEFLGKSLPDRNSTADTSRMAPSDSLLFATSFAAALEQAQEDYEEINVAHEDLDSMVSLIHTSAAQWEAVCQKQDQYIKRQKVALREAQRKNALLRHELNSFRRKCHQENPESAQDNALAVINESSSMERAELESLELPTVKELISPAQVESRLRSMRQRRQSLRTKSEMRGRSLLL